ncbi:MAG TPA: hypothetical protein VGV85_03815 [Longimicrobiaceae bacterium]|nr:hypothetical protein [Longimicrobiaceae bacterium]
MSTAPVEAPGADAPGQPLDLRQQLLGAAGYVAKLRRGPRAVLRRMEADPEAVPPEVFWDIVARYQITPRDESFWRIVLPLMVRHEHAPGVRPGVALARSGVSGARLERWLRLSHAAALREAGRLFARVEGGVDWTSLGPILRFWTDGSHRDLARQFFLSREHRERATNSSGG